MQMKFMHINFLIQKRGRIIVRKICCFAGHSKLYNADEIYSRLISSIENLIVNEGVTEFWVGNYGAFDRLSAKAVRELKAKYPGIRLVLIIPYVTSLINENRESYYKDYDEILVADIPESTPHRLRIIKSNQYMVKSSQFLICYAEYSWGGAAKTLEYAKKRKISIINIAL